MKNITLVAATPQEIISCKRYLELHPSTHSGSFLTEDYKVDVLITGIGILNTTFTLMDYLSRKSPDLWIQVGVGGALDRNMAIGDVFLIESEYLFGFGAQDKDGTILNPFELGWISANEFPYNNEKLVCPDIPDTLNLPRASAVTVIHAHGEQTTIEKIRRDNIAQIENMEGASFFFVSLMKGIAFLSLRSISNFVEERNKSKWHTDEAIEGVNKVIINALENKLI